MDTTLQKLIATGFTEEQAEKIIKKHIEYGVPMSFIN